MALTLTVQASAHGTTDPAPGAHHFALYAEAEVTAVPDADSTFTGWTGDASGTANPLTVEMTRNKTVKANFTLKATLTLQTSAHGTTSPAPGPHDYVRNSNAVVWADPDSNCYFTGWTGDASGTANPLTVKMSRNKTVKANFKVKPKLTIQVSTWGSTTPSAGIHYYNPNTSVTVTANPYTYAHFLGWSGAATGTTNPVTVVMTADKTLRADFHYIYAPSVSGEKVVNRSFSQEEYIDALSWQNSSDNDGLTISKYKIYSVSGSSLTLLAEVNGDQTDLFPPRRRPGREPVCRRRRHGCRAGRRAGLCDRRRGVRRTVILTQAVFPLR